MLIKRSLHQSPDYSVSSTKAICKHGEIYKQKNSLGGVEMGVFSLGLHKL